MIVLSWPGQYPGQANSGKNHMATVKLTNTRDDYTTKEGDEFVYALKGNDKITIQGLFYDQENEETRITVYGGPGDDHILSVREISGQAGYGGPGNDRIEIHGGDTDSGAAIGAGGNDTLICLGGDEGCFLSGGGGQDRLINQSDSEASMVGGPGRDLHTGNAEAEDFFVFFKGDTVKGTQRDVIKGFVQGQFEDTIDLSATDANSKVSGNQAFTFVASTKNPAIGEVSYYKSGTSTVVVANDGAATFEIELQNFDQPLEAADFSL